MIRLVLAAASAIALLAASPVSASDGILLGSGAGAGVAAFGLTAALLGGHMMAPIIYPAPPVIYAPPLPPVVYAPPPMVEIPPLDSTH
jgi:hypothetical protein